MPSGHGRRCRVRGKIFPLVLWGHASHGARTGEGASRRLYATTSISRRVRSRTTAATGRNTSKTIPPVEVE